MALIALFTGCIALGFCLAQADFNRILHVAAIGVTMVFRPPPTAGDPYILALGFPLKRRLG